ncbi:MAG: hypothetical protein WD512_18505 [Candidatus Paceibacterota bacterium]
MDPVQELLLQNQGKGVLIMLIYLLATIGITIYSLYLSRKQSIVKDQMAELIKEVKEIKGLLKE